MRPESGARRPPISLARVLLPDPEKPKKEKKPVPVMEKFRFENKVWSLSGYEKHKFRQTIFTYICLPASLVHALQLPTPLFSSLQHLFYCGIKDIFFQLQHIRICPEHGHLEIFKTKLH